MCKTSFSPQSDSKNGNLVILIANLMVYPVEGYAIRSKTLSSYSKVFNIKSFHQSSKSTRQIRINLEFCCLPRGVFREGLWMSNSPFLGKYFQFARVLKKIQIISGSAPVLTFRNWIIPSFIELCC